MARKIKRSISKGVGKKSVGKKQVPSLIKVLSVLGFIGAVCTVVLGILFLAGATFVKDIVSQVPDISAQDIALINAMGPALLVVLGIIFLGLAILDFFVARGLWKGHNWARVFLIVLLALGVLSSISNLFRGRIGSLISLAIEGLLIWYLGWNKNVKAAYS